MCADARPTARSQIPHETEINTHELIRQAGFMRTDASEAKEMEALVAKTVEEYGRLDMHVPNQFKCQRTRLIVPIRMVNNAGISIEAKNPQPIHTTSEETWDITMRVNAKSVFLGCKYATMQMLAQEPHQSGSRGWIINICCSYGLVAGGNNRECLNWTV